MVTDHTRHGHTDDEPDGPVDGISIDPSVAGTVADPGVLEAGVLEAGVLEAEALEAGALDLGGDVVDFPDAEPAVGRVLTMRQHKILQVIRDSVERRGYPPSVREIGAAAGLKSPSSVAHQLKVLEKRGLLRRDPNRPRAVDIRPMKPTFSPRPPSSTSRFNGPAPTTALKCRAASMPRWRRCCSVS